MKPSCVARLTAAARSIPTLIYLAILWLGAGAVTTGSARADDARAEDFFENRVRPVLSGICLRCHGPQKTSGGLRLDSREGLARGGDSGPAIDPGHLEESLLLEAVRRDEDVSAMPPDRPLSSQQVADLTAWVRAGAPWPARAARIGAATHWAFQPIRDHTPPAVRDQSWPQSSIDRFILARIEAAGRKPAPPADRRTLLRRVAYDLTGLPPSPGEVVAFTRDSSPDALAKVVDRLLDSPHYGEQWGRHWLDLVRYADTAGETADYPVPLAWRYRNYVIDAFNADKPYDEFLREQIAGDILAAQGPREHYAERATASGFLAISRRFGFDSENYHHLTIQDTIDTLGQTMLGLSLGCARCHDHKFDPVSMNDYYALYGIFDSSRYAFPGSEQKQQVRAMLPLLPPDESQPRWRDFEANLAALARQLEAQHQSVPKAIIRSLHDLDGDFELQAPAAGGSNGVLVPPWLYEGKIAVTTEAQSPFKNLYPRGKVGMSVPEDAGRYRVAQALYPRHCRKTARGCTSTSTFASTVRARARMPITASGSVREPSSPAVELLICAGSDFPASARRPSASPRFKTRAGTTCNWISISRIAPSPAASARQSTERDSPKSHSLPVGPAGLTWSCWMPSPSADPRAKPRSCSLSPSSTTWEFKSHRSQRYPPPRPLSRLMQKPVVRNSRRFWRTDRFR